MVSLILQFVLLACVIVIAGTFLARCADRIAEVTKLGRSLAGLVLLAGATSLPELAVGWSAVKIGAVDLAVGGFIGSSLFNLLILAMLDLLTRTRGSMLSRTAASHALAAIGSMLLTTIALLSLLVRNDGVVLRIGIGSWAIILAYLFSLRLIYHDSLTAAESAPPQEPEAPLPWRSAVIGYVTAAAAIFLASPLLAQSAEDLADVTGLGRTFFGTVFIACVTSLPEAVTTLAAIRLGTVNMAIGNIFGSNAFNVFLLGIADFAHPRSLFTMASQAHAVTATCVILVTAVATSSLLYRAEKRWWVIEPDALLITILIIGSLVLVYLQ